MKNTAKATGLQGPNQAQDESKSDSRTWQITMTFQQIMRDYAYALTPAQLAVLFFVMDRTVGWGKRWEVITQRHFLYGIPAREGNSADYAGKLKMSLNTLKGALRELLKAGIVREQKGKGRSGNLTAYSLSDEFFFNLPDEAKTNSKRGKDKKSLPSKTDT